jgi:hypothetical protein
MREASARLVCHHGTGGQLHIRFRTKQNTDKRLFMVWFAVVPLVVAASAFGVRHLIMSMVYTLHKKMTLQLRAQRIAAGENEKLLEEDLMHAAIYLLDNVTFVSPVMAEVHTIPADGQLSHEYCDCAWYFQLWMYAVSKFSYAYPNGCVLRCLDEDYFVVVVW